MLLKENPGILGGWQDKRIETFKPVERTGPHIFL
jgi:hypothetical protein